MLNNPALFSMARLLAVAFNCPPMQRGESGPAVARMQEALVSLGHPMPRSTRSDGSMDGQFGGEMHKQVSNFQVRNGIKDTLGFGSGTICGATMIAIDAKLGKLSDPSIQTPGGSVPKPPTSGGLDPAPRMTLPESAKLLEAYEKFRPYKGAPCRRHVNGARIRNQCAIRMSIALGMADCGFDYVGFKGHPHTAKHGCCDFPQPHTTNATMLWKQIEVKGLKFEKYWINPDRKRDRTNKKRSAEIHARLTERKGIIYMNRCFGKKGSHIDYWDGQNYMNSVMNYHGSGEPRDNQKMIYTTKGFICFLPIKNTG